MLKKVKQTIFLTAGPIRTFNKLMCTSYFGENSKCHRFVLPQTVTTEHLPGLNVPWDTLWETGPTLCSFWRKMRVTSTLSVSAHLPFLQAALVEKEKSRFPCSFSPQLCAPGQVSLRFLRAKM